MARISKANTYAINWLAQQNKSKEEIAQELKVSVDQVSKVLEQFNAVNKDGPSVKTAQEPTSSRSKNLMINTTMGKKTNTVSIMTKDASEYNDTVKKNAPPANPKNNRYMNGIFVPSEAKKKKE